jgi:hypothetical protein
VLKALGQKVNRHDPLYVRSHARRNAQKAEMRAMLPQMLRAHDAVFDHASSSPPKGVGSKIKQKPKPSAAAPNPNNNKQRT